MKTIRTIIATLSGVLLTFALVAWFSVRRNAAFIQRTIYQGFDQTFVVALVMGCAFLLIAVILTVAIVSTDNDEDGEDEQPIRQPRRRPQASAEQPYRRVTQPQPKAQLKAEQEEGFARPKGKAAEQPKPKKRERVTETPDAIVIRREEASVKKAKKHAHPAAEEAPVAVEAPVPVEETPAEEAPVVEPVAAPEPEPEPEVAPVPEPKEEANEPEEAADEPVESANEPEAADEPEPVPDEVEEAPEAAQEAPAEVPASAQEDMIHCVFCGASVARGAQVCPNCGKKM